MRCVYYLSPTLKECERIADDLNSIGLSNWLVHLISHNETGVSRHRLQSANYVETLDLYHSGVVGGLIGFCVGLLLLALFHVTGLFSDSLPFFVNLVFVAVLVLFGVWEGGLWGVETQSSKLAPFQRDLDAGHYLILIYAPRQYESQVRNMMLERHPDARLAAVDPHFILPFSRPRRL
ncbi:hypothetical protein [Saccharospirillum mangrovi]|uniref:hypothetical protein n=1 Tax=Saccharospirillum mangrovi TaxID=2161747 RepID=UPI001300B58A|nr:hypothetical protein [Saccharospirillum mangrovi]